MKYLYRFGLSLLICVCLLLLSIPVFASETEETEDLDELFAQAIFVVPDTQKAYSERLNAAYARGPYDFMACLVEQESRIFGEASFFWLAGKPKAELEGIAEEIKKYPQTDFTRITKVIKNLIFLRDENEEYQANQPGFVEEDWTFDVVCVKIRIGDCLESVNAGRECIISNSVLMAYETDPYLFARVLSEYTKEEIDIIVAYMAEKYVTTKRPLPTVDYSKLKSQEYNDYIQNIQSKIYLRANEKGSDTKLQTGEKTEVRSVLIPSINSMTYSNAEDMKHGDSGSLNVTLIEPTAMGTIRQWWVEVYAVKDGSEYLIGTKNAYMTYGASTLLCVVPVEYTVAGEFYTRVEIYSEEGGTLLTERTGAYPDIAYGRWQITVSLPENRANTGTLKLYDSYGNVLKTMNCLGKSDLGYCQCRINGNTPIGTYDGQLGGPESDTAAYGPYMVIKTQGISGFITQTPRSGIWVHGGRSQTTLQPTYGCVRIFNAQQLSLQTTITELVEDGYYSQGKVIISQAGDPCAQCNCGSNCEVCDCDSGS